MLLGVPVLLARQSTGLPAVTLDLALARFWSVPAGAPVAEAAAAVLAASDDFDTLYTRLRAGRSYRNGLIGDRSTSPLSFAPAAVISRARRNTLGLWHPYLIVVPRTYDPAHRYPVRVYLQGDTTRLASSAESGVRWLNYGTLAREDAIVVFPGAWNGLPWWGYHQVEHMHALLDELKRTYNVDENRVYLLGSSDGGTAIYYHAMVSTTSWAAFLPFNADPTLLTFPEVHLDAQLHATNLSNKPLFVVHGERDLINPVAGARAWLDLFERAGAVSTLRVQEGFGHETRWWDAEQPAIDAFIAEHPRDPLPDRLTWETSSTERFNRASWVIIDELGMAAGETAPETPNVVGPLPPGFGVGLWADGPEGLTASMLQPGSVAAEYGLHDGDVVRAIEGVPVRTFEQLLGMLQSYAGKAVQVEVLRADLPLTRFISLPAVPEGPGPAFRREAPSGRLDVERQGNTVTVRTRGVRRFTLLLSPDEFDLSQPIVVVANGVEVFRHVVAPSAEALLEWAARDHDRTMLFGAELEVALP